MGNGNYMVRTDEGPIFVGSQEEAVAVASDHYDGADDAPEVIYPSGSTMSQAELTDLVVEYRRR